MSRAGDNLVRCCKRLHHMPAAILCVLVYVIQAVIMDFFLVTHLGPHHLAWIAGDILVMLLLSVAVIVPTSKMREQMVENAKSPSIIWVAWLLMQAFLAPKVVISFVYFSTELEESDPTFLGPNTLKTTVALGSCIFLLLLFTQHDAKVGSENRRYIDSLTGTVIFDILDTADMLDILFNEEVRALLNKGLEEAVLFVACLNLILPTLPLVVLTRARFGHHKPEKKMVYLHRIFNIIIVNLPNLIVRMILWHGFSVGISPFALKNIILIVINLYEFYEHKLDKYESHQNTQEQSQPLQNQVDDGELSLDNSPNAGNTASASHANNTADCGDWPKKSTSIEEPQSESEDTSRQHFITEL